ncbi:MAG: hypothetical protein WC551_11135 [Patescibacteria group bacterium]
MKILLAILLIAASADSEQPLNRQSSIDNHQSPTPPAKWQNPSNWRNIKTGITPDQTSRLLGDPADTDASETLQVWYYAGKEQHPKDAVIVFRNTPAGLTLQKYTEPLWTSMPTWQQLTEEYNQALADQRAADMAERQRLAAIAAAEQKAQTEAAAEARRQRSQELQESRILQAERLQETRQTAPVTARAPSKSFISDDIWIIAGLISLIILGVTLACIFRS